MADDDRNKEEQKQRSFLFLFFLGRDPGFIDWLEIVMMVMIGLAAIGLWLTK